MCLDRYKISSQMASLLSCELLQQTDLTELLYWLKFCHDKHLMWSCFLLVDRCGSLGLWGVRKNWPQSCCLLLLHNYHCCCSGWVHFFCCPNLFRLFHFHLNLNGHVCRDSFGDDHQAGCFTGSWEYWPDWDHSQCHYSRHHPGPHQVNVSDV